MRTLPTILILKLHLTLPELVLESYPTWLHWLSMYTLIGNPNGQVRQVDEMEPKCHRVTCQAGHQKATQELYLRNSQVLSHLCYPTDTHRLTSPQEEADVRNLEGIMLQALGGGGSTLCGWYPIIEVAPHPYWRSDSHTHTLLYDKACSYCKKVLCVAGTG